MANANLEELLMQQQECMNAIARAVPNVKKMGKGNFTVAKLRNRLSLLQDAFRMAQTLHWQLARLVKSPAISDVPYFRDQIFLQCEDEYNNASDYIAELIAQLHPDQAPPSTSSAGDGSSRGETARPSSNSLPRVNLPTFSGDIDKWESFRDRFKSLIIDDPSLSDVTRLHHLNSCLKDDAADIIRALPVTENNFKVAWSLITSRFDNDRHLIHIHLRALMSLPSVSDENAHELRSLRNKVNVAVQSLRNLNRPVDHWDDLLVFLVSERLDASTRRDWELRFGTSTSYPTYAELDEFLAGRILAFGSMLRDKSPTTKLGSKPRSAGTRLVSSHATASNPPSCPLCLEAHGLHSCSKFLEKLPAQRFEYVKSQNRCINCLGSKHLLKSCPSKHSCRKCKRAHHTLLHFEPRGKPSNSNLASNDQPPEAPESKVSSHVIGSVPFPRSTVLLATARVRVTTTAGRSRIVRALLDQGSVVTLISEKLARQLNAPKQRISVEVSGIGEAKAASKFMTTVSVSPSSGNGPAYSTSALILNSLSRYEPPRMLSCAGWDHIKNISLADPDPMSQDPIELIIGVDLYGVVLLEGFRTASRFEPLAQNSIFGWILSGPIASPSAQPSGSVFGLHVANIESLEQELRRFWEIENVANAPSLSIEEERCEKHFADTHSRDSQGRYVVRLPFKEGPPINIGETRRAAEVMLRRLELRLAANFSLKQQYTAFIQEYERLGHMRRVSANAESPTQSVYLPHHAVVRPISTSTKLRVVFNASQRSSNGSSLNDHQWVGPKLQADLPSILLRWRQFRYVLTADIVKMYRQILVDPRDLDYQRILWRQSPSEPIEEFQLLTVTYGTASAPFLALRVLKQLCLDEGDKYPLAVEVLRHHAYVDDCIFGADTESHAIEVRDQLIALFASAHLELSKWASNSAVLLPNNPDSSSRTLQLKPLTEFDSHKVLGIEWLAISDSFRFQVMQPETRAVTKRSILSLIAKLYDPLGWVAPVVVTAKILLQQLWLCKQGWDDPLPPDLQSQWDRFQEHLHLLNHISIPRYTDFGPDLLDCQLHGFADASSLAYAAVIYLRVTTSDGRVTLSLLTAKSKVAPVKALSIPRFELSAALLLSRLLSAVIEALHLASASCYCWTDSMVTLQWLAKPPVSWKTFVANRVAEIQDRIPHAKWQHVPSLENPADCASRGLLPSQLAGHKLWWQGPAWLSDAQPLWPAGGGTIPSETDAEARAVKTVHAVNIEDPWLLPSRYSSWPKLLRVSAFIFRFIMRVSRRNIACLSHPDANVRCNSTALQPAEIHRAKIFWIRHIQSELFFAEIVQLKLHQPISRCSLILSLNPFLDEFGILRVGGRLRKATIPSYTQHPAILKSHPLVTLIIKNAHIRTLHAGSQLTLHTMTQEYWLLRGRPTVRSVIHQCVACVRENAKIPTQLMGDLPKMRVTRSARAFLHCGIDYAGPFSIKSSSVRGAKTRKAYIALFICLTVKAIHLELVSDYSTDAFVAAFRRFCARRGLPNTMYSDNGTNFRGADRELTRAFRAATRDPDALNRFATDQITWSFIPPSAPHFGGLWEAAIRSVKSHLKRVVGAHLLTFEEFSTLLCNIEACLNSRPLAPVSENFDDFVALTPGHFLIGSALTAAPEPSLLELKESRLSRWQLLQQLTESFWRSWTRNYIHGLQQRRKWKVPTPNVTVGRLVLLRNSLEPPCKWALGRVTQCINGEDGRTRVVKVKTAHSEFTRPISKICLLPIESNDATAAVSDPSNT